MKYKNEKEYQTIGLFSILGILTALLVVIFKLVLFAPPSTDSSRQPAESSSLNKSLINKTLKR